MKSATYSLIFNRKGVELGTEDKSLVQIVVYHNGRRKYFSTGIYLTKEQWNPSRSIVVKHSNQFDLNRRLKALIRKMENYEYLAHNENREFSLDRLQAYINGSKADITFVDWMENDVKNRGDLRESTRRAHLSTVTKLRDFGKLKYFTDLTIENVQALDNYMIKAGMNRSSIHGIHKRVISYINRAISFDLITNDRSPYKKFKNRRKASDAERKYLTEEELAALEKKVIENPRIGFVRDCFVLACYTGLAYSDMKQLTNDNLIEDDGEQFIRISRTKTEEKSYVMLLPEAAAIINKYKDWKPPRLIPIKSNQKMNEYLKEIADICGIQKHLTTHVARHTFATTVTLLNGVPLETVSKMLGHSSIKTTQIYAKIMDDKIKIEMKNLRKKRTTH